MEKAININGEVKVFSQLPKTLVINGKKQLGLRGLDESQLNELGFKNVIRPALTSQYQKYAELLPSDFDEVQNAYVFRVEDNFPTIQEVYEQRVRQANSTFDMFRDELNKAMIDKLVLGNVTPTATFLINEMRKEKVRILTELDNYLANNNFQALLDYSFDTPEAEAFLTQIRAIKEE